MCCTGSTAGRDDTMEMGLLFTGNATTAERRRRRRGIHSGISAGASDHMSCRYKDLLALIVIKSGFSSLLALWEEASKRTVALLVHTRNPFSLTFISQQTRDNKISLTQWEVWVTIVSHTCCRGILYLAFVLGTAWNSNLCFCLGMGEALRPVSGPPLSCLCHPLQRVSHSHPSPCPEVHFE